MVINVAFDSSLTGEVLSHVLERLKSIPVLYCFVSISLSVFLFAGKVDYLRFRVTAVHCR